MVKNGGWNCPVCTMRSTRHWNVERHIGRLHEGLGEPVNESGKTKEQCQIDMNMQISHNNQNSQKLATFRQDRFKESRFSRTHNYGMDNNKRWDFMDEIIEPVKKMLEFTKVLTELKSYQQLYQQNSYQYPSAISYQYPSHMSSPINLSSVGSMNTGNNSKSLTNQSNSNNQGITREELIKIQLYTRAADWFQSRNWSSPS